MHLGGFGGAGQAPQPVRLAARARQSPVGPPTGDGEDPEHLQDDVPDTDAWFVAFAPARKPRVAVGVLFTEAGAGGDVAAPAAREVLVSSLQRPTG